MRHLQARRELLAYCYKRRDLGCGRRARAASDDTLERVEGLGVTVLVAELAAELSSIAAGVFTERALERRAEREARRINVAVKDGVVTLSGSVQSWAERNAVERVAG